MLALLYSALVMKFSREISEWPDESCLIIVME